MHMTSTEDWDQNQSKKSCCKMGDVIVLSYSCSVRLCGIWLKDSSVSVSVSTKGEMAQPRMSATSLSDLLGWSSLSQGAQSVTAAE